MQLVLERACVCQVLDIGIPLARRARRFWRASRRICQFNRNADAARVGVGSHLADEEGVDRG